MKNSFSLLLLPGFDGTGELFQPLQAALDKTIATRVCRYTTEESFDDYVETAAGMLPLGNAVLVAESFSGPVALALMTRYPARIACAVLCATFAISPFRSLTRVAHILPTSMFHPTSLQRYVITPALLREKQEGDSGRHETHHENAHGELRFDHVNFSYRDDRLILRDVSFHVRAGRTVAIVGVSGSGKSSLIRIARAALKRPRIFVFDEATSSLDSATEQAILHNLIDVSTKNTTLVIAHRLSTVVHAHEILVLDHGAIAERGTHLELRERDGPYAKLWLAQQGGAANRDAFAT